MARTKIYITIDQNGRIGPGDAYGAEQLSTLPRGDYFVTFSKLTARGRDERDGLRGLWFAGLKLLSENTEDPRYDTPEKCYANIRIDLGYSRPRWRRDGTVEMVPISTSDAAFPDEEMHTLQERAREFCLRRFGYDPWLVWTETQEAKRK